MKGAKPKSNAVRRKQRDSLSVGASAQIVEQVGVAMPVEIANDPVQSQVWTWIAPATNQFKEQDIPALKALCYWYAVLEDAKSSMEDSDGRVRALVSMGEDEQGVPIVAKNPAVNVMKSASAEIRALSDQLGLSPLARSRIGLMQATTAKSAAETAAMFRSIDEAYGK